MKLHLLLALFPLTVAAQTPASKTFALTSSTLSYHMTHAVHEVDGVTHAAKGKGNCNAGVCDFLLAAPVKTFDSGDTNRDLHMLQVVRGAEFPVVTVRFRMPESAADETDFAVDLEVTFAGQTDHYFGVRFHQEIKGPTRHITGVVPSTLSGFKIPPPSFLGANIRNEIPVRVDTQWTEQP